MTNVIAEAAIRIRPDTTGFQQKTQAGVLGAVKKIAVAAGGIFAAQKIFDFGKQAVEEAALTQKATENIKAQFGSSAKSVLDFGESAAHAYGISKSASETFSSTLGLTAKNLGIGHKAAAEMDINLQKLAGSVGLIKGEDPAGFFDKLKLAVLGNTRGLKQLGISVDTTSESQFALNHHLVQAVVDHTAVTKATLAYQAAQKNTAQVLKASGKGSVEYRTALNKEKQAQDALDKARAGSIPKLTAAQKAQAIVGIATQHLAALQDEARKHTGDFADEMIRLKAELSNVKEEIGAALLPALAEIAKVILDDVVPAVSAVVGVLKSFIDVIPPDVWKGIALGIGLVAAAWGVYTVAQYAAATALLAMNAALSISPLGLVVIGVVALVAALYVLYNRVKIVHEIVQAAFGFLRSFVPAALNAARSAIEKFVAVGEALWHRFGGAITSAVRAAFTVIKNIITTEVHIYEDVIKIALALIHGHWSQAWNAMKDLVGTVLHAISSIIHGAVGLLGRAMIAVGQAMLHGIISIVSKIPGAVAKIIHAIPGAIGNLGHVLFNAGVQLVQGMINGIESMAGALLDKAKSLASSAADAVKGALGIGSPSKLMHDEVGIPLVEGIISGIDMAEPALHRRIRQLGDNMHKSLSQQQHGLNISASGGQFGGTGAVPAGGGVTIQHLELRTDARTFDALRRDALNRLALGVKR